MNYTEEQSFEGSRTLQTPRPNSLTFADRIRRTEVYKTLKGDYGGGFLGELGIRGERVNGNAVKMLETAKSTLSKLHTDIQDLKKGFDSNKCCFFRWWLSVKLYMTSFSAKRDELIRSVNSTLDDIIKI